MRLSGGDAAAQRDGGAGPVAIFQDAQCGSGGACAGAVGLRFRRAGACCAGRQAPAGQRSGGSQREQRGSSCVGLCRSSGGWDWADAGVSGSNEAAGAGVAQGIAAQGCGCRRRCGVLSTRLVRGRPRWGRRLFVRCQGQPAGFGVRHRRFLRQCFPPELSASPRVPAAPSPDIEYAETVEKGHGRIEVRRPAGALIRPRGARASGPRRLRRLRGRPPSAPRPTFPRASRRARGSSASR